MEDQRLAIISFSPQAIFPGCDQPFLCSLLSCCRGSALPASSPACVQFSDSWKQWFPLCPELLEVPARSCGVSGISPYHMLQVWPETINALVFAARVWCSEQEAQNSKWEAQFQLLFVTYSKWGQFAPEIVGFMNAYCHNCSPCSRIRHNTTTELICLCWMLLFHCVYFLSVHLSAFGYSAARRRDWKIPFCFLGSQPDHVIW